MHCHFPTCTLANRESAYPWDVRVMVHPSQTCLALLLSHHPLPVTVLFFKVISVIVQICFFLLVTSLFLHCSSQGCCGLAQDIYSFTVAVKVAVD